VSTADAQDTAVSRSRAYPKATEETGFLSTERQTGSALLVDLACKRQKTGFWSELVVDPLYHAAGDLNAYAFEVVVNHDLYQVADVGARSPAQLLLRLRTVAA